MRLGILGGCFDPIHIGHILVAQDVLFKLKLSRIIFVPSFSPPHRPPPITPYHHRVKMVQLAIKYNPRFKLSQIEKDRTGPSYTVDTLRQFRRVLPKAYLYFILGYDQYRTVESWHNPEELTQLAKIVVISRPKISRPRLFPEHESRRVIFLDVIPVAVSAQLIRERLAKDKSIRYLVTTKVAEYIYRHRLYRVNRDKN
ncbi:MAG: nicotinate-nucleotide adenylyltransferase [candidate division WOR-3 bacterium]